MKKAKTYLFNSLAGALFIALLAVNVQVGNGNSFLNFGENFVSEAKAGNCDPGSQQCAWYEFPNGKKYVEYGEVIVVTPEEE